MQAVCLSFWVQISTGWQLSCVQAEALICYMHSALAHSKNVFNCKYQQTSLFKSSGKDSGSKQSCSWDIFFTYSVYRHFLCKSHGFWCELQDQLFWQAKRNIFSSTVSKPNQQDMTFCVFSVKTNCSLVLEVKGYIFSLAHGMTEFQPLHCSSRACSHRKTWWVIRNICKSS